MDEFLKMDIFFAVATLATALIGTLASVALFFLIRILRTMDRISQEVEGEARAIRDDLAEARQKIKRDGFGVAAFLSPMKKMMRRLKRRS